VDVMGLHEPFLDEPNSRDDQVGVQIEWPPIDVAGHVHIQARVT
jgi:hypothetical protein